MSSVFCSDVSSCELAAGVVPTATSQKTGLLLARHGMAMLTWAVRSDRVGAHGLQPTWDD